ncbi:MAG: amidohydrolase family protein [Planctomycetes bacterium]|nr:amidohydrolase family protein [Planctomycetota bacterium]
MPGGPRSRLVLFRNCRLITPWEDRANGWLRIHGDEIAALGHFQAPDTHPGETVVDLDGLILAPGFVDIHCHGAGGGKASDEQGIATMARFKARRGGTAFVPTRQSVEPEWLGLVEHFRQEPPHGALVLGAHVEGVYVNPVCIGGLSLERSRSAYKEGELDDVLARFRDTIALMTLSPEIPGGPELIRTLVANDVVASVGHSCVTWEEFQAAVSAGLSHATHLFNATRYGYPPPERGLSRARLDEMVMLTDDLTSEVICDGAHVHPIMLRLALKAKGLTRISLITDATFTAGLPEGRYARDDGEEVYARPDDVCRSVKDNRVLGSNLTMDRAVRNAVRLMGVELRQAVQMATINPARVTGMSSRMGSLEVGKEANLVAFDERLTVRLTCVRGVVVFDPEDRCPPCVHRRVVD